MDSFQEEPCPESSILKFLPEFVNTFGSKFGDTCILCRNVVTPKSKSQSTEDWESSITQDKVNTKLSLKDVCVRSVAAGVLPLPAVAETSDDQSYPFCDSCTETVSDLTELYRKLEAIQDDFNLLRGQVVHRVIRTFMSFNEEAEQFDEETVIGCWEKAVQWTTRKSHYDFHKSENTYLELLEDPIDFDNGDENNFSITDIKLENEEEIEGDEEEIEEFINPVILEESHMNPIVRLGKPIELDKIKQKGLVVHWPNKFEKEELSSSKEDSEDEAINQAMDEDDDYQPDPDDENEYYPPYGLKEVQIYPRITRKTSKMLPLEVTLTEVKGECNFDNSPEETPMVIRVKRKYTRREPGETSIIIKKKKKSSPKKAKSKTSKPKPLKVEKTETDQTVTGDIGEGEGGIAIPKAKKKRLRKKPTPVQCEVCGKSIYSKTNLVLHMRTHTGEKPFKCTFCPMSFYKKSNLTAHLPKHTNEKKHPCDMCDLKFSEKCALRNHKAARHHIFEAKQVFQCEFCLKKFVQHCALKYHLDRTNCKEKGYRNRNTCLVCTINFENQDQLLEHEKTEEHMNARKAKPKPAGKKSRAYKRKYNSDGTIKKRVKNPNPIKKVYQVGHNCKDCDEKFSNVGDLKKHKRRFHPSKDYVCEICGKAFSEVGNMNKHIAVHKNLKRFACHLCDEKFCHSISLKYHISKHTGEPLYKCEHCSTGFTRARSCRKHLAEAHPEVHLKEKPIVCKICFINVAQDEEMIEHMKIHDGLICPTCGKMFGMKMHLRKHILTHTGEKPFACTFCDKRFNQETNLKEHIYRHTGERPFRCIHCNAGFIRRKEMQNHIDKNHTDLAKPLESQEQKPSIVSDPTAVQVTDMTAVSISQNLLNL